MPGAAMRRQGLLERLDLDIAKADRDPDVFSLEPDVSPGGHLGRRRAQPGRDVPLVDQSRGSVLSLEASGPEPPIEVQIDIDGNG